MIYDGALRDTTNFASDQYLEINSCNVQHSRGRSYTVIRDKGRVDYHILYVVNGECLCLYGGKEYLLKKGNFVIYPPHERQRYSFMEKNTTTTMWLHFSGQGVPAIFAELGLCGGVFHTAQTQGAETAFLKMINHHSLGSSAHRVAARGCLMLLLSALAAERVSEQKEGADAVFGILEYVHLNWQKPLSLADIAGKVNLSESRVSHLFKDATGKSVHRYIADLRIAAAKEFLTSTEFSVARIGEMVGFEDPLYFSRVFRAAVGVSPIQYRAAGHSS